MGIDYRLLFQSQPGLFVVLKPDFTVSEASDDYLKAAAITREQLIGRNFIEQFSPPQDSPNVESFDKLRASLKNVISTRKPGSVGVLKYIFKKPGTENEFVTRYWTSRHSPILGKNGEVELIVHRSEEVTDFVDLRDKGEAAVQERFFQVSLDMLCISSYDGYFKKVNPAFTDVLGYTPEEFCANPYLSYIHPDDIEPTKLEVEKQLLTKQQVLNFENRYLAKDGSYKLLSWKSAPVGDLMYAAARDVTATRAAETELRRMKDQLEIANRELEAFSYSAAHDLRAPLRSMTGFLSIISEDKETKLSEDAKHCINRVTAAAHKMGKLIDALLNLSQISRRKVQPVPVDLSSIAVEISKDLQRAESERPAEFKIASDMTVQGDPQLLKAAVGNLLGNAWKYTAKSNRPAHIEFGQETVEGRNHFFIRDNGVGFDMKHSGKLFGVFQRLHSPTEFDGLGIGLATTLRIIHAHGGKIWATGEPGKGASFYFTL